MESWVSLGGKEGHTKVEILAEPKIEPDLVVADVLLTAPTRPSYENHVTVQSLQILRRREFERLTMILANLTNSVNSLYCNWMRSCNIERLNWHE